MCVICSGDYTVVTWVILSGPRCVSITCGDQRSRSSFYGSRTL